MGKLLGVSDIQDLCMDMLEALQTFCEANNIRFYMAGGTLLGAVRHQGFIPWDDDVDLMIPRPDYERLVREFKHDRYVISSCEVDGEYLNPFGRMWDTHTSLIFDHFMEREIGVFIDLFAIDGYPEDDAEALRYSQKLYKKRMNINWKMARYFQTNDPNFFKACFTKLRMRKSANYYSNRYNEYVKRLPYEGSAYVGVTTTTVNIMKERNPRSIYENTVYLPFGRLKLPSIGGYDHYLKHLYGDYMQLPPEDERITTHTFRIRLRDVPGNK